MDAHIADVDLPSVAAAIGDPARARMLCSLLDGHARTATELAAVGEIGASTASGHFARLREQGLIQVDTQGKHRYYRLASPEVAAALEALLVVAGVPKTPFKPTTPHELCFARTCYRHMAGDIAVRIHDACFSKGWLVVDGDDYALTEAGVRALNDIGLDASNIARPRRRFAKPCMDWSVRRPHLGGVLADALLARFLMLEWVTKQLDSRVLSVTPKGERHFERLFGVVNR